MRKIEKLTAMDELDHNEEMIRRAFIRARNWRFIGNLLLFLAMVAVLFLLGSLTGCTKKPQAQGNGRRCWACIRTENKSTPLGNSSSSSVDSICDRSQAEIKAYEDSNTYSQGYGANVSVDVKTLCQ